MRTAAVLSMLTECLASVLSAAVLVCTPARRGMVVQTTAFRLSNRCLMEGEFDRTRQGLFLRHQFGLIK